MSKSLGGTRAFAETMDTSQRQENDMNLVLTSRTSFCEKKENKKEKKKEEEKMVVDGAKEPDFIENPQRINVTLTGTKSQCFILLDVKASKQWPIWKKVLSRILQDIIHSQGRLRLQPSTA